jgi:hypothetical protein
MKVLVVPEVRYDVVIDDARYFVEDHGQSSLPLLDL